MPICRNLAWAVLAVFLLSTPRLSATEPTAVVAHIRLAGSLDEAPAADDPIFGHGAENLRTKLERIKKAKDDKAVKALFLEIDGVSIGWGKLDELHRAIADFRKGGKKVFAYLQEGESKDYLLALGCDEVAMPESAWLMLTGMRGSLLLQGAVRQDRRQGRHAANGRLQGRRRTVHPQ